jgi:hypothetical protein
MPLDVRDRFEIVHLSADWNLVGSGPGHSYTPVPIAVDRLMLSSMGAWLKLRGDWGPLPSLPGDQGSPLTVSQWQHIATQGRDQYVKVVTEGYLFPFGHRAALVKVTERKFKYDSGAGGTLARLWQRMWIVVRQPVRTYAPTGPVDPNEGNIGRKMPFESVRITNSVTPNLDDPGGPQSEALPGLGQSGFWPRVGGQDFLFHLIALDRYGQSVEMTTPLVFVGRDIALGAANRETLKKIGVAYSVPPAGNPGANDLAAQDPSSRVARPTQGQKIAFAPESAPGDTTLETLKLVLGSYVEDGGGQAPPFWPVVVAAQVEMRAVQQLSGVQAAPLVRFYPGYVKAGFEGDNQGGVFLEMIGNPWKQSPAPVSLGFSADRAGGLATPNIDISGISRHMGPVGGVLKTVASGQFNPADFFKDLTGNLEAARILGGISLADILQLVTGLPDPASLSKVPRLLSTPIPNGMQVSYKWETPVQQHGVFVPANNSTLSLSSVVTTYLDGKPPDFRVEGHLTNFALTLLEGSPFISVAFSDFAFISAAGQKLQVQPHIQTVQFLGPLQFVNELSKYLSPNGGAPGPGGGFDDPPFVDVQSNLVKAGYTLTIPTIAVGVFSLANVSLGASLTIPFTSDPMRIRFAFCERSNPFTLSVSLFAGGGFFAIEFGLDGSGIETMEASLEFGGNFSLDIGVASGGVYVMAGIYFKMGHLDPNDDKSKEAIVLTGYLRCGGSLNVLGLVSISVEFYMGLTYESAGNKVWGQATLTVCVHVLFFSTSVGLSVEREFADPPVGCLLEPDGWSNYCAAFA